MAIKMERPEFLPVDYPEEVPKEQRFVIYKEARKRLVTTIVAHNITRRLGFCRVFKRLMDIMKIPNSHYIYTEFYGEMGLTIMFPELKPYKPEKTFGGYWFNSENENEIRAQILENIINAE